MQSMLLEKAQRALCRARTPILGLCVVAALAPGESAGHPHAWIDLKTAILVDDTGRVTGVREDWLFDDFYTAFVLEEVGGTITREALLDLAARNLTNLKEYSYFTFFEIDGVQPAYRPVTQFDSEMRDDRLSMQFTVSLVQPADPRTARISYAVYDPTYYVEVLHAEAGDAVRFSGTPPKPCHLRLEKAKPSVEDVAFAAALDQTQSAGDGLGVLFAERVHIDCTE
jgi:ABC-type uncharacterized transport system substrate-binding protein